MMYQILQTGQIVKSKSSGLPCKVEEFLGGGGQGEVYRVKLSQKDVALKWYYPASATPDQQKILENLVDKGPPSDKFLWPLEMAFSDDVRGFGYIMPLREPRFKGIPAMLKRQVEPSFRALCKAGFGLSDSFWQLHAMGLCYRDISYGNLFLDPDTGEVLICDNDNVVIDGQSEGGVLGTPKFMAPEIVRGEALPSSQTDLYSLAVLLFYLFILHHPLDGAREANIHCKDLYAMRKLYGTEPVFIFDPVDSSNRPVPDDPMHVNALAFWPIYPQFLRDLFTEAFTEGVSDPENGRVRETIWREAMVKLNDQILYCPKCGCENFYDIEAIKKMGKLQACWSCNKDIPLPPRLRIEDNIIMLNHDTQLFPHHIDMKKQYDFSAPIAEVTQHPEKPGLWGLKNLSEEKWVFTTNKGEVKDVEPGKNTPLVSGIKINFGSTEGEIRG